MRQAPSSGDIPVVSKTGSAPRVLTRMILHILQTLEKIRHLHAVRTPRAGCKAGEVFVVVTTLDHQNDPLEHQPSMEAEFRVKIFLV